MIRRTRNVGTIIHRARALENTEDIFEEKTEEIIEEEREEAAAEES